jgi:4'-phosphopantetheinyl transferase
MTVIDQVWCQPPEEPPWPHEEVHVWRATLAWPDAAAHRLEQCLSADERDKMQRFRFEKDRRRYLIGRGVLRMLLGRYLDLAPRDLRFETAAAGKPHLASGQRRLEFNLAHSGEYVLIAITEGRAVGIDLEEIRDDVDAEQVAAHFFSPGEQRDLETLTGRARIEAFFVCWSRKEAYVKARGEGLSLPLDQFDVSLRPGEAARLIATRPDPAEAKRWHVSGLEVADGYKAALVVEGQGGTPRFWDCPAELVVREPAAGWVANVKSAPLA